MTLKTRFYKLLELMRYQPVPYDNRFFWFALVLEGFNAILAILAWLLDVNTARDFHFNIFLSTIPLFLVTILIFVLFKFVKNTWWVRLSPFVIFWLIHFQWLLWLSIFFGERQLVTFVLFLQVSIGFCIFNICYQLFIVDKILKLPDNVRYHIIYLPLIILSIGSAVLAFVSYTFSSRTNDAYMFYAMAGISMFFLQLSMYNVVTVFNSFETSPPRKGKRYNSSLERLKSSKKEE